MNKRDIKKLLKQAEACFKAGKNVEDFIKENPKYKPDYLLNISALSATEDKILIGSIAGFDPEFEDSNEVYDEIFEHCFEIYKTDCKHAELFCPKRLIDKLSHTDKYSPNHFTPTAFRNEIGTYCLSRNGYKVKLRYFMN